MEDLEDLGATRDEGRTSVEEDGADQMALEEVIGVALAVEADMEVTSGNIINRHSVSRLVRSTPRSLTHTIHRSKRNSHSYLWTHQMVSILDRLHKGHRPTPRRLSRCSTTLHLIPRLLHRRHKFLYRCQ